LLLFAQDDGNCVECGVRRGFERGCRRGHDLSIWSGWISGTAKAVPFQSDERQTQVLRLATLAQDDKPEITLRMTKLESGDDGEGGDGALGLGFGDDGVEVGEDLGDGHGVDLAAGVGAFLDELPEEAAGDLGGELVGDDLAGALLLLGPGVEGQGDP